MIKQPPLKTISALSAHLSQVLDKPISVWNIHNALRDGHIQGFRLDNWLYVFNASQQRWAEAYFRAHHIRRHPGPRALAARRAAALETAS